jgi:hypothetical protein
MRAIMRYRRKRRSLARAGFPMVAQARGRPTAAATTAAGRPVGTSALGSSMQATTQAGGNTTIAERRPCMATVVRAVMMRRKTPRIKEPGRSTKPAKGRVAEGEGTSPITRAAMPITTTPVVTNNRPIMAAG